MKEAPFPVDPVQTGIAIAYKNEEYIADAVLPRVPVGKQSYKYQKYDKGEQFTIPNTRVGRKGKVNEVEFTATEATDSCRDYGLEDAIPQDDIDNAEGTPYNPVNQATESLTDLVLLDREKRTADLVFNTATYGSQVTTLSGTDQFSDASSDPLGTIMDTMDSMIMRPNTLVLGQQVYSQLVRNPKILKGFHGNSGDSGRASLAYLRELFEVEQILVGAAWRNTAKEGQTVSMARLWGKHVAMLRLTKNAGAGKLPTFGFTAQWGTRVAGSRPDPDIGLTGGTRVRSGERVNETICAADFGWMLENAVA